MKKNGLSPVAALVSLILIGCSVKVTTEQSLVFRYSEGVQSEHEPTYRDYYLACHPSEPDRTLASRLKEYEELRRTGVLTFSPDGIEMIKITALGRGSYFEVKETVPSGDTLRFRIEVKPEYASVNYNTYPEKAVVYVLGQPFPTVLPVKVGSIPGPWRKVLKSVNLDWTWQKAGSPSPGWCLVSVHPVPGSAAYQRVQFREAAP